MVSAPHGRPPVVLDYRPRGGVRDLFFARDSEILVWGPAGTGKSRGATEYINLLCEAYPGSRHLFVRKTRASMSETVMATFEDKVCTPELRAYFGKARRNNRSTYIYPNGSMIVLAGMDEPTRLFSAEFNTIYANEANELREDEWEFLHRAARDFDQPPKMPWQQIIGDCNPDAQTHWLYQRMQRGILRGLRTTHADNPAITPEFLHRLDKNTFGTRRQRLFLGEWCNAEGMVWPDWDPLTEHLIDAPRDEFGNADWSRLGIQWFFGSMDFGTEKAGVLQVWGVDRDRHAYRVAEVYHRDQVLDWWAECIDILNREFQLRVIVADPSGKGMIDQLNVRLGKVEKRDNPWLIQPADNDVLPGLNLVRWMMKKDDAGIPRMRFIRDALRFGTCESLLERRLPTCTEQEIPTYVLARHKPGGDLLKPEAYELPDRRCEDHGCDATRYAMMWLYGKELQWATEVHKFEPGSCGALFGHADVLRKIQAQERGGNPWTF